MRIGSLQTSTSSANIVCCMSAELIGGVDRKTMICVDKERGVLFIFASALLTRVNAP